MSENKVKHILEWEAPRSVHEGQQFLGFANFYRRFIRGYSSICRPLTQLTKKGQVWNWTNECQEAFNKLKVSFTEAPILTHYHPKKPLMIETDASDLAKGAVLSQYEDSDKKWHPVAFYSKKFSPAELNYDIHDKEMVVIVDCFKEWRHMLCGSPNRVVVYTDHRNLEYFQTTKILNRRQARWAEILSEFNFVITYRPGEKNGKADALSRRTDPALEGGSDTPISMFKPGQLAAVERTNQLLVQILGQNGKVPTRSTEFAAGYDLYSAEEVTLKAKTRQAVSTEIAILVPSGTYGRIAPRSGLALNNSIEIGAGVVDEDYRGPIKVILINHGKDDFIVKVGDRIAQLVLECIVTPDTEMVNSLPESKKGDQGFGSTGVSVVHPRVMAISVIKENPKILTRRIMAVKARERETSPWLAQIREAGKLDDQWMSYKSQLESGKVFDTLSLEDSLMLYKKRYYIPNKNELKLTVTRRFHDAKVAGHFSRDTTTERMTRT